MSLFDQLVDEALKEQRQLAGLRGVAEKELLHHDILREMSQAGLLSSLTFIGDTCLRACYGSYRLSEDLDFSGGADFKKDTLADLGKVLERQIRRKYGLNVQVSEPVRESGNVDTWKIKIVTRPGSKSEPMQRINIDICSVPSYDRRPMVLRNHYRVDMGTSGLVIQAQSMEEIYADKMVAFAFRPNRIKNRDLWDIGWLEEQAVSLPIELVKKKVADHKRTGAEFCEIVSERIEQLFHDPNVRKEFLHEMQRFLPREVVVRTVKKPEYWEYLTDLIDRRAREAVKRVGLSAED